MNDNIRKQWYAISRLGLKEDEGVEEFREIILLNRILSLSPIVMAVYLPIEVFLNGWKLVPAVLILIILLLLPLWLNKKRFFEAAKVITIVIVLLFIFFAGLMVGKGVNNHVAYIPGVLMSLLLFKSKRMRIGSFIIITFVFLYQQYLLNFVTPYYEIEPFLKERFSVLFFVLSLFLNFIIGWYFLSLNSQYETIIEEQKSVVEQQKHLVEEKHKEITDSINYAERIQRSFLATTEVLDENLNDYFVLFKPKDIVSGDFYWAGKLKNGNFAIVNADSTGHGVPGAIMSILNISSIEKAVDKALVEPNEIFNDTRKTIIERLKKDGSTEGGKDGMDASLISINPEKTKMDYVAAQNPIWIIRNEEFIEMKPEKMPVGKHENDNVPFVGGTIDLQKGDLIYTITDGFQDQFGGSKGKKFMVKKMREYLLSISSLSMKEQHQKLNEIFINWKGEHEQVDDICIIGVRI